MTNQTRIVKLILDWYDCRTCSRAGSHNDALAVLGPQALAARLAPLHGPDSGAWRAAPTPATPRARNCPPKRGNFKMRRSCRSSTMRTTRPYSPDWPWGCQKFRVWAVWVGYVRSGGMVRTVAVRAGSPRVRRPEPALERGKERFPRAVRGRGVPDSPERRWAGGGNRGPGHEEGGAGRPAPLLDQVHDARIAAFADGVDAETPTHICRCTRRSLW